MTSQTLNNIFSYKCQNPIDKTSFYTHTIVKESKEYKDTSRNKDISIAGNEYSEDQISNYGTGTQDDYFQPVVNRQYKDRLFRMIFREKKDLLSLYNALNGTGYSNEADLEVNTLENAVYLNMKNDISFLLDMHVNLYEHQSTVNPNMPVRDLFYISRLYQQFLKDNDIYSSKQIKLPTPHFVVWYNGTEDQPARKIMRLSEQFEYSEKEPSLELIVLQININPGFNNEIVESCEALRGYVLYNQKVREYRETCTNPSDAVRKAVDYCIHNDILADFFKKNKAEAITMCLEEYDAEFHERCLQREAREDGRQEGIIGAINLLKSMNITEDTIICKISREYNLSAEEVSSFFPADFSKENNTEPITTCLEEYDAEFHERCLQQEAREDGRQEGLDEGLNNTIRILTDMELDEDIIIQKISGAFQLSNKEAAVYVHNYQQEH